MKKQWVLFFSPLNYHLRDKIDLSVSEDQTKDEIFLFFNFYLVSSLFDFTCYIKYNWIWLSLVISRKCIYISSLGFMGGDTINSELEERVWEISYNIGK